MRISRYPILLGVISLLSVFAITLIWGIVRKSQLDDSSRQLVLDTTEVIFTNWVADSLVENAHNSFQEVMSEQTLNSYISIAQSLGSLDRMESISGSSVMSLNPFASSQVTANYEVQLTFGSNSATVISDLIYENDRWQFTAFRIQAELLTL